MKFFLIPTECTFHFFSNNDNHLFYKFKYLENVINFINLEIDVSAFTKKSFKK